MATGPTAETVQALGRKGVGKVKSWLESTLRFEFQFTVYEHAQACSVTCLDNTVKRLDMVGKYVDKAVPVFVESKRYGSAGGQTNEFRKLQAIAYSATAKALATHGNDPKYRFLWVTTHPFALNKWSKLTSVKYLKESIELNKGLLDGAVVDDDLAAKVSKRVWVLVTGKRQMELRLSNEELHLAKGALSQGKKG